MNFDLDTLGRMSDAQLAADIARYTGAEPDWDRLNEEANEINAEALAEMRAKCLSDDALVGDALQDWMSLSTQNAALLAHAMRAALEGTTQYLDEIRTAAVASWARDYADLVTAEDLAEREKQAKEDFYEERFE